SALSFRQRCRALMYILSLHDALPIYFRGRGSIFRRAAVQESTWPRLPDSGVSGPQLSRPRDHAGKEHRLNPDPFAQDLECVEATDRKSTRLNSSHQIISYAVFCLKKQ